MAPEISLKPLPPEEAIKYFQGKGYRFSWKWQEMWHEDHVKAFTVAKAMRLDILQDIRGALDQALNDGTTFETFKKNLTPLLQEKGWWGKQEIDGQTVQLGSTRRLNTIFNVNVQTSYQAGHYRAMTDPDVLAARPCWRYVALNDGHTRPQHLAWANTILPADHPWWNTHYPPNGWNCRCTVVSVSKSEMERDGRKITKNPDDSMVQLRDPRTGEMASFPAGIDPGWDYNPGKESVLWDRGKVSRNMKILPDQTTWQDLGLTDLRKVPMIDRIPAPALLAAGRDAAEAEQILADAFGLSAEKKFIDIDTADGDKAILHIDQIPHMVAKRQDERERYGSYLLETLKNPYEVWLTDFEDGLRKQYIGLFTGKRDLLVSVVLGRDGSVVWNIMQSEDRRLNDNRRGYLRYGK